MRKRQELTLELRKKIKWAILSGYSGPRIALLLGVNIATVYREVKKNGGYLMYDPESAHASSRARVSKRGTRKINIKAPFEISDLRDKVYALQQQVDILFELIKEG